MKTTRPSPSSLVQQLSRVASHPLTIVGALLAFATVLKNPSISPPEPVSHASSKPTAAENSSHSILRKRLSTNEVSATSKPVFLYRDGDFAGNGILRTTATGQRVLTLSHLFPKGMVRRRYSFQILRPHDPTFHPIASVEWVQTPVSPDAIEGHELVWCIPGESVQIEGLFPKAPNATVTRAAPVVLYLQPAKTLRSLLSADEVRVQSALFNVGRQLLFILPYRVIPCESGEGFVSETDELFLISASRALDDLGGLDRLKLGIPVETRNIALAVRFPPEALQRLLSKSLAANAKE